MKYLALLVLIASLVFSTELFSKEKAPTGETVISDCNMTFAEAMRATNAPKNVKSHIVLVKVEYYSFDGRLHSGQLLVDKAVKKDIVDIFKLIKKNKFPIQKVIPIVEYNWSDEASMADNNTSVFNYRFIKDTKRLSNHALGKAIDFNPVQNPAVYASGEVAPKGAVYDATKPGTLDSTNFIVTEFKKRGWRWGGDFTSFKDYQHFDKEK